MKTSSDSLKEQSDNKIPVLISGQDAFDRLIDHFLGKGWHVVDSMSQKQSNAIAIQEIIDKFPNTKKRKR